MATSGESPDAVVPLASEGEATDAVVPQVVSKAKPARIKRPERPDKAAMEEQVRGLEEKIKANRIRIDEIKSLLDNKASSRSDSNKEFRKLRDQHAAVLVQIRTANDDKQKIWQELKVADEARKRMKDDARALRDKLRFVTVDQIDEEVRKLEHRMQHSTLPLNEEKKLIQTIKDLAKSREFVKDYSDKVDEIAADEKGREGYFERIRTKEAQITALKQQEQEKKRALEEARKKESEQQSDFPALVQEKQRLFEEINGLRAQIKEARDEHWAKHKEWQELERLWQEQQREDRHKAYLEREAIRKEREEFRKQREAENYVEPYTDEIIFVDQLTHYLQKLQGPSEEGVAGESKEKADIVAPKGFGNMIISKKKKGDEELDGFFSGMGSKKGKGKGRGPKPKPEKISLSLDSLTSFTKVGTPPPANLSEVPETLEKLKERKEHFQKLQLAERERRAKAAANGGTAVAAGEAQDNEAVEGAEGTAIEEEKDGEDGEEKAEGQTVDSRGAVEKAVTEGGEEVVESGDAEKGENVVDTEERGEGKEEAKAGGATGEEEAGADVK